MLRKVCYALLILLTVGGAAIGGRELWQQVRRAWPTECATSEIDRRRSEIERIQDTMDGLGYETDRLNVDPTSSLTECYSVSAEIGYAENDSRPDIRVIGLRDSKQKDLFLSTPERDQSAAVDKGFEQIRPLDNVLDLESARVFCYRGTIARCSRWYTFALVSGDHLVGVEVTSQDLSPVEVAENLRVLLNALGEALEE